MKFTNFFKGEDMTNKIQKLNQQIEKIKSLKEELISQEEEIKSFIETFQCSAKIKSFLSNPR